MICNEQRREARNAKRQALVSKRSTSEDLVNERNRAAMMKAYAALTLVDDIKVRNQMDAITLSKSANLPAGWECLLQIHIANAFPASVPSSTGTAFEVGNSTSISCTGHSDELTFINKTLNADVAVCSPDDRNSSSEEEENENTGSICE